MELLLNVAWLLLALPAYWLWRGSRTAFEKRNFTELQALLALGCVLVILFPVISATDDLLAMRAEVEESPVTKRGIRHAGYEKVPGWHVRLQNSPMLPASVACLPYSPQDAALPPGRLAPFPAYRIVCRAGRAPPAVGLV